jgi:hypothetical protein
MPGLAALALGHMMSTITPESSFALLLAASAWEDLRLLVEVRVDIPPVMLLFMTSRLQDYVVERWQDVSRCHEFEQCCEEVAGGEYVIDC